MSERFKVDANGLICPWCDQSRGVVYIAQCHHNPFALVKQNRQLLERISKLERAETIIDNLKELLSLLNDNNCR